MIGYEDLRPELDETGKRVLWKTPQKAQVGDVAVIYLMRPIMAMVATARVTATPQWQDDDEFSWSRGWFAELGDFRMAARPLQLQDARRSLPGWAWPRGARNAARVPDEFARPLLERLDDRRRSGSAAAPSFVEREIDAPTEPRVAVADPDAVGRGLKAHERTVARLAELVAAAGLTPHRALVGSPAVDLAWRTADTTVLVEAKSLTRRNEVRQLRLGVGQLLHYRFAARDAFPSVVPVLAVERPPTDRLWSELCEELGIRRWWPGKPLPGLTSSGTSRGQPLA